MVVINLPNWEAFENKVASLYRGLKRRREATRIGMSPLFFRGQACDSWKLQTTLERYSSKDFTVEEYYQVMLRVLPAVQSYTEKAWGLPYPCPETESIPMVPHGYEFMVYLRHHRFPSPLLDWSRSPYVAAFFAFEASPTMNGNVAIFAYVEYIGGAKFSHPEEPRIVGCGPYVASHKRHFNQQSAYTVCRKQVNNEYYYCSHEDAFVRNNLTEDLLIKYVIPRSERDKVLEKLHLMNITAYSLFGSEDSLMETLAFEEIDQRGRR